MRQVVYLDEVILVNLVMNLTVLWLTARFNGNKLSLFRILAAASVGSIYALTVLFPGLTIIKSLWVKLMMAVVMVWIAFGFSGCHKFGRDFLCLFIAGFFLGGLSLGLHYLLSASPSMTAEGSIMTTDYQKWFVLVITIIIAYCIGKWGALLWRKKVGQMNHKIPLTVKLWGNKISVEALVDTGNQLVEPISQHPVVIIEYEAIKPILPREISGLYSNGLPQDGATLLTLLSDSPFIPRLRLIPFQSLGKDHGMLLGIRPDEIEVSYNDTSYRVQNVLVGIYHKKLSNETTYRALLHPQLLTF
ncbi:sigma-E processing peptidase SpoIIGA [Desulfotomaculum sp. 1211_IL3151]|uniref:sigma-E processing peptidase SpoIIGA n=1 Tax=Desulfotomaculum sp. 1211_IL3151 TaxID=3084055 RepID=UPI002FDAE9C8